MGPPEGIVVGRARGTAARLSRDSRKLLIFREKKGALDEIRTPDPQIRSRFAMKFRGPLRASAGRE